jgi:hypothetical protein
MAKEVTSDALWDEITSLFPPDTSRPKGEHSSIDLRYVQHVWGLATK